MAAPTTVEDYLAVLTAERRAGGGRRSGVKLSMPPRPKQPRAIAYGMPALRSHGGQFLVSYAAYKNHYSLFPASEAEAVVEACGDELTPYLSGRGTIQFPADKPTHRARDEDPRGPAHRERRGRAALRESAARRRQAEESGQRSVRASLAPSATNAAAKLRRIQVGRAAA